MLDAYALLALYQGEPGARRVAELIEQGGRSALELYMCVVNIAEVLYELQRRRGLRASTEIADSLADLPLQPVPVDLALSIEAARLKAEHPISLADCYAAALAMQLGATLVTGDRDFRRFEPGLTIEWLADAGTPQ